MSAIDGVAGNIRTTAMDRLGTGVKIGSVNLPDFKRSVYMYTKTEPSRSDEELKEAISKMAREDAEKGNFQKQTRAFLDLKKEYISSVSPDRENIITNSMKQIDTAKQMLSKTNSPEPAKTLWQLLMDMEKKSNNKTSGGTMYDKACFEGDKLTYVEFYDSNGEMMASYSSNNGWDCISTKAEIARQHEFSSTYNEAWNDTKAEINAQKNPSVPKYFEGGAKIDAYA